MEEPINRRLFEKYLKDDNGSRDPSSDWEMSQSSVSDMLACFSNSSGKCPFAWQKINPYTCV
jgi:hypothetical protein